MEDARRWLADRGVVERHAGWADAEMQDRPLTTNEVAHSWTGEAVTDEGLESAERVRLAFGLLDLLDEYWVTCELRLADRGLQGPLPVFRVSSRVPVSSVASRIRSGGDCQRWIAGRAGQFQRNAATLRAAQSAKGRGARPRTLRVSGLTRSSAGFGAPRMSRVSSASSTGMLRAMAALASSRVSS